MLNEIWNDHVLQGMSFPVGKDFVIGKDCDLNYLLYKLTSLENLVSSKDISMNFSGQFVCDKTTAERKVCVNNEPLCDIICLLQLQGRCFCETICLNKNTFHVSKKEKC